MCLCVCNILVVRQKERSNFTPTRWKNIVTIYIWKLTEDEERNIQVYTFLGKIFGWKNKQFANNVCWWKIYNGIQMRYNSKDRRHFLTWMFKLLYNHLIFCELFSSCHGNMFCLILNRWRKTTEILILINYYIYLLISISVLSSRFSWFFMFRISKTICVETQIRIILSSRYGFQIKCKILCRIK